MRRLLPPPAERAKPDFSLSTINIIFLLLLFYVATGSLVQRGEMEADVPVTEDLPLERLPRPLLLVTGEGLFLDGVPVVRDAAPAQAHVALERMPEAGFLNVLAERTVPAAELLDIAAGIQTAGVPIRLVTLRRGFQGEGAGP